jgi:hypothetical protein
MLILAKILKIVANTGLVCFTYTFILNCHDAEEAVGYL